MSRRSSLASALSIVTASVVVLSACGEQTPGGLPDRGRNHTGTEQDGTDQNVADPATGGSGAQHAAGSDANDPIVVKIGDVEFLTNMAIYRRYNDAKETPLALQAPVAPAEVLDGGKKQDFVDGTIYWSPGTGAQIVRGQILATYLDNGGPTGRLGWPVGDETAEDAAIYSDFERGQIRLQDQAIRVIEHTG
ncbi:LGFP repeat-containing protein [Dietzia sp. ANT_WB102]|uniref:LGFP repeat-containing protein n=1 Tax=Dietzia sp. ANT_WB102 TaxID=2597345 RepID=UPI0011EC8520|nr:hypothetical protein [Dietzia sp. ANT_WB102]KAA0919335.1 hypothetical protein FQ137_08830 [Dietzia sp. ANT_WB102]